MWQSICKMNIPNNTNYIAHSDVPQTKELGKKKKKKTNGATEAKKNVGGYHQSRTQ